MKYAVAWRDAFEAKDREVSGYWYGIDDDAFSFMYTSAINKEDAANKYLA